MSAEPVEIKARRVDRADGWSMRFFASLPPMQLTQNGYAELHRDNKLVCRFAVAKSFTDCDAMLDALHARAIVWIADWKSRDHSGDTDFADLC